MIKIAHIQENREQSIKEHLHNVARMAADFCVDYDIPGLDASMYAYEVGLAHDIGKYADEFQRKIKNNLNISIDHSTAGAKEMQKLGMPAAAFAIAGHHGGIPNGWDTSKQNLRERMINREIEPYSDYVGEVCLKAVKEPKCQPFEETFFTRMVYSALVDADFLDTEQFMSQGKVDRCGYDDIDTLYERFINHIVSWRNITEETSELNRIRTGILEQCLKVGEGERGLYRLTVPTGGGKTMSSLAFALQHAKANGMKRVIYVIPYTSIIEQNVAVFKEILGAENVLAHYSNSLLDSENEGKDYFERHKLSIENWDAPVIVTTSVQFFESFYSNKVSKCRKLHNVSNSIIIFDEAQMIPLSYLKPCLKVIQNLVKAYKVSAVLCTATQPALERWMEPIVSKEIYPDYQDLFRRMKRTQIKDMGRMSEEELIREMNFARQVLAIVNTKGRAQALYQKLQGEGTYHLSTYMTPADRKETLQIIRDRLKEGKVCKVIATSLVEAGVDLDFPVVFRELAGLDSIIQAAGRCNREGRNRWEESTVWVFHFEKVPRMIEKNVAMTEETFQKYGEYDSLEAIRYYFTCLQSLDVEALDQYHIVEGFQHELDGIVLPFKKVAEIFHLIDSNTKMVIIPVEREAVQLVQELEDRIKEQENFKRILQKLGVYAINLYDREYRELIDDNSAYEVIDGIAMLQRLSLYTKEVGMQYEKFDGATMV